MGKSISGSVSIVPVGVSIRFGSIFGCSDFGLGILSSDVGESSCGLVCVWCGDVCFVWWCVG